MGYEMINMLGSSFSNERICKFFTLQLFSFIFFTVTAAQTK